MHIPENYLSPATCAVMGAAMVPVWAKSIKKVALNIPKEKMPLIGLGAAFSFVGMMFNIPLPGGTTGHAVGGTLIALLLGPEAACLAMSIVLLIQALLFGDGGILALGANCFNMAFILPFVGFAIYKLIANKVEGKKGELIGAAVGSYVGINAAALAAAIEFGIQPLLFNDAAGQPLYCPYGLTTAIPAMMIGHLTIFGLAEVLFTTVIYAFVLKNAPDYKVDKTEKITKPAFIVLAVLMILTPIGLLAEGTAWGEWGVEEFLEMIGYTPAGMETGFEMSTIMPDYAIGNLPDIAAYILSAIIGVAIVIILFRVIAAFMHDKKKYAED